MKAFLSKLFDPGTLQMMAVISTMLFFPLEKRKNWRITAVTGLLLSLLCGVGLQAMGGETLAAHRWIVIPQNIFVLLFSYGLFRVCTRLSSKDAVYGVTCMYIIQHLVFCLKSVLWGGNGVVPISGIAELFITWAAVFLVGGGLAWLVNRHLPYHGHYHVTPQRVWLMSAIVILIAFVLTAGIYILEGDANVSNLGYDLCSCALILWIIIGQRREIDLLAALQTEQRLRRQMQEQYELSRDSIDIINRKSHDLKHQIEALKFIQDADQREASLSEIERSALIYDAAAKTGNEVLDTVLTEKALLCERDGISWTCMADGSVLDFLPPVDLYTMMGNALDNAIEASRQLTRERQAIRVVVRQQYGSAFVQISNYYDWLGTMRNGIPETTKSDKSEHGYGIPSIREIVERYGGVLDIETSQGIFLLSILIPCPN